MELSARSKILGKGYIKERALKAKNKSWIITVYKGICKISII